jgi:hypothetical protein
MRAARLQSRRAAIRRAPFAHNGRSGQRIPSLNRRGEIPLERLKWTFYGLWPRSNSERKCAEKFNCARAGRPNSGPDAARERAFRTPNLLVNWHNAGASVKNATKGNTISNKSKDIQKLGFAEIIAMPCGERYTLFKENVVNPFGAIAKAKDTATEKMHIFINVRWFRALALWLNVDFCERIKHVYPEAVDPEHTIHDGGYVRGHGFISRFAFGDP